MKIITLYYTLLLMVFTAKSAVGISPDEPGTDSTTVYVGLPKDGTHATFEGKDIAHFRDWVMENLRYPPELAESGTEGRVIVAFVIDRTGNLCDMEIIQSPEPSMSRELLAVLEKSPIWEPAKIRSGKTIHIRYVLPVRFKP